MNSVLVVIMMYSETGNACFHVVRASIGLVVSAGHPAICVSVWLAGWLAFRPAVKHENSSLNKK